MELKSDIGYFHGEGTRTVGWQLKDLEREGQISAEYKWSVKNFKTSLLSLFIKKMYWNMAHNDDKSPCFPKNVWTQLKGKKNLVTHSEMLSVVDREYKNRNYMRYAAWKKGLEHIY